MRNEQATAVVAPSLRHLEQLMADLTAGVILVDPSGVLISANAAALRMHGVKTAADLGATADEYCQLFSLRFRNHHRLTRREYPIMRMLAGESFPDLVVEVTPMGADHPKWTHEVHDVVMDEDGGEPDCLALVFQDVSPHAVQQRAAAQPDMFDVPHVNSLACKRGAGNNPSDLPNDIWGARQLLGQPAQVEMNKWHKL